MINLLVSIDITIRIIVCFSLALLQDLSRITLHFRSRYLAILYLSKQINHVVRLIFCFFCVFVIGAHVHCTYIDSNEITAFNINNVHITVL